MNDVQMPSRVERWARFVHRRRRLVLLGYVVALAVFGAVGGAVFSQLQSAGYDDPSSESVRVDHLLDSRFGVRDPAVVLAIVTDKGVDDAATAKEATALLEDVSAAPGVEKVVSYWTSGQPPQLRGADGKTAQALVYGTPDADVEKLGKDLAERYGGQQGALDVQLSGYGPVADQINRTISADLARAESIAIPITLILLLIIFGSAVAAGLPFVVAAMATLGSFFALFLVTQVTDVSIFALNLVTALGLALGIDYALLMISRFREELPRWPSTEDAVAETMRTAGRTVLVSGITVAITLAALLVFPLYFLQSFAYAGIAVSLMAVLGAFTGLPALLAMLGPNVNRLKVRRGDLTPGDVGIWSRIAERVMRRPWPVLAAGAGVLLALAIPALHVVLGQVDDRVLPRDNPAAIANATIRAQFPGEEGTPHEIVLRGARANEIDAYAKRVSTVPTIERVQTPTSIIQDGKVVASNPAGTTMTDGDLTRVIAVGSVPFGDGRAITASKAIRALPAPAAEVLVGGATAKFTDSNHAVTSRAPLAMLWIGLATLIILFLYTGSVLIPIKAVLLNLLGLAATLGVLVWTFQGGHLTWLTGDYIHTGTVDLGTIVLIGVVAFALSMDYELFLLSRITEEHAAGADTRTAVARGIQRTGRIITAAALLIAIVFAAFVTSNVTIIKQLGVGVVFAILVDATLIRGLLVPALMRIAGRANWWAPAWLRRVHARFGLSDA